MTAQTPERIMIDGIPHALESDPLFPLLDLLGLRAAPFVLTPGCTSTGCWRGYCGTWRLIDKTLCLVHMNKMWPEEPLTEEERAAFFSIMPSKTFPIAADWFTGRLRIPLGHRLVYSHHGWSSWYERQRTISVVKGKILRDRVVNTQAILERAMRRRAYLQDFIEGKIDQPVKPLIAFDHSGWKLPDPTWLAPGYGDPPAPMPPIAPGLFRDLLPSRFHQVDETAEEVAAVPRARRRFGVVLHRKRRTILDS